MEPVTIDRVQQMIDDEAAQRFPAGAVPRLVLLQYGDHPVIEPGELYLRVILGQDGATRDAWMEEHGDRLEDFRAQRLPEVKGLMVTTDVPDSAGRRPAGIMKMDGISLLDPEEDEIARGLTPVMALLGPVDLATLDALITAGIAASRAESARWAWPASASSRRTRSSASGRESPASPSPGRPGPGRAGPAAKQARCAGEGALPRRRGAAGRAAAVRRRPVGRAGRPAGPGIYRRGRGRPVPARPGSGTTRR